MTTYTIDADNTMVAHPSAPTTTEGVFTFASEKDLTDSVSKDWPITRLVELWNSFAGVTPVDELKPVKKFTNRQSAIERIWNAAQSLAGGSGETRADKSSTRRGKRRVADSPRRKHSHADKKEAQPKKLEVIADDETRQGRHALRDHGCDGLAEAHHSGLRKYPRKQKWSQNRIDENWCRGACISIPEVNAATSLDPFRSPPPPARGLLLLSRRVS